jgi:hypothetical protein
MLMDVIPLDASLVKGSHGRRVLRPADQPVLLCERPAIRCRRNGFDGSFRPSEESDVIL